MSNTILVVFSEEADLEKVGRRIWNIAAHDLIEKVEIVKLKGETPDEKQKILVTVNDLPWIVDANIKKIGGFNSLQNYLEYTEKVPKGEFDVIKPIEKP